VEDCHSEDLDDPGDKGDDDNTDGDGHAAARDGGEYLSRDDAVDHSITNHDNDIKQDGAFGRPVSQRPSGSTRNGTEDKNEKKAVIAEVT
jgi:hypothetical protein